MERTITQIQFPAPMQPAVTRVAAYARVSGGKDAMLHSLSAQVSYYSKLIQNHPSWVYCGVFSDEAFTGTKENREGFQSLLAECCAGNIDLVITKSISRFARNTVTLLETVRELKLLGVDVFFEEQNIHTLSAEGELMMTILASYAQEESRSASENQKWRIRKGFENGELVNLRFLFGYHIRKGGIEIDQLQAQVVREVFQRFIAGESMGGISEDLNARELKGALGGRWCVQRIRDMLSNEKYLGNALLQKTFVNNHLEKRQLPNRGELPKYYAEGTHPAIIDADTFGKAQELLQRLERKNSTRKRPFKSAFTGKIVCARCGKNYKRVTTPTKHHWNCPTFLSQGKRACPAKQVPEETLYALASEVLGLAEFDADAFHEKITAVRAEDNNTLVFCFKSGEEIVKRWQHRSRAESWTPEMKEIARQRTIEQRRRRLCQEQQGR